MANQFLSFTLILLLYFQLDQVILQPSSFSPCGRGWISMYGSCYLFSRFQASWAEAEVTCNAFRSNLVEINGVTEFYVLTGHLQTLHPHDSNKYNTSYWIGGNDIESEHHFVWVGSKSDITYTRWYPGQPDVATLKQDCIEMYGRDNFEWHDTGCETKNYFICETKIENGQVILG